MIRSMTGYARDELVTDRGTLTWEMRTVNHRYLEMHFRLPEEFRAIEPRFRGRISARLGRISIEKASLGRTFIGKPFPTLTGRMIRIEIRFEGFDLRWVRLATHHP